MNENESYLSQERNLVTESSCRMWHQKWTKAHWTTITAVMVWHWCLLVQQLHCFTALVTCNVACFWVCIKIIV